MPTLPAATRDASAPGSLEESDRFVALPSYRDFGSASFVGRPVAWDINNAKSNKVLSLPLRLLRDRVYRASAQAAAALDFQFLPYPVPLQASSPSSSADAFPFQSRPVSCRWVDFFAPRLGFPKQVPFDWAPEHRCCREIVLVCTSTEPIETSKNAQWVFPAFIKVFTVFTHILLGLEENFGGISITRIFLQLSHRIQSLRYNIRHSSGRRLLWRKVYSEPRIVEIIYSQVAVAQAQERSILTNNDHRSSNCTASSKPDRVALKAPEPSQVWASPDQAIVLEFASREWQSILLGSSRLSSMLLVHSKLSRAPKCSQLSDAASPMTLGTETWWLWVRSLALAQ